MKNKIEIVIKARESDIGIPVRRILPYVKKRMVGPFIFLDHMGPILLKAPKDHMDVRPHPHIGLSTLTYLFEGKLMHRDSLGVKQLIVPGQINWMTAGKGISHSEREPDDARGIDRTIHGLQFWVALPVEKEDVEPSFNHYEEDATPVIQQDSLTIKLVAGSAFGKTSKLKAHSPMLFMVMSSEGDGKFSFDKVLGHEHAVYLVKGKLTVDGEVLKENELMVFKKDSDIELSYFAGTLFVLIGGEPFPETPFIWWNLVSSSKEKIELAKKAWTDGSFPQVPGDPDKIPVPEAVHTIAKYP
jgi:redox-sensitive bicupin YhaK (pirin superfamily)